MARLFVCGDIVNQFSGIQFVSEALRAIILDCDYAIGNLEGVVAPSDGKALSMMQHCSTLNSLKEAGFDLLLLANNHIADYGFDSLNHTCKQIRYNGLDHMGAGFSYDEVYAPKIINTTDGISIGFVNICEAQAGFWEKDSQRYGYAWIGHPNIDSIIIELRMKVDYLIVFVHAGLEHYRLPLNSYRRLYRHYCDLGADYVVASHPHVPQGIEHYNNSSIVYSLGNFFFPRKPNDTWREDRENISYSIILELSKDCSSIKTIEHKIENNMVALTRQNEGCKVDVLSNQLGHDYYSLIHEQNKIAFNERIWSRYKKCLNGGDWSDKMKTKIKVVWRYLFCEKYYSTSLNNRMKLLYRLSKNETCRFLLYDYIHQEYE